MTTDLTLVTADRDAAERLVRSLARRAERATTPAAAARAAASARALSAEWGGSWCDAWARRATLVAAQLGSEADFPLVVSDATAERARVLASCERDDANRWWNRPEDAAAALRRAEFWDRVAVAAR